MIDSCENLVNHNQVVNISDLIGSWGPFQKRLFTLIGLIYCVAPYNSASLFYYAIKDDLICVTTNGSQIILQEDKCSLVELDGCSRWFFNSDRVSISSEWTLICERYWLRSVTLAAYIAGQAFSGSAVGYLSDKLGRKFAIKVCILIEIVCEFFLTFTVSFPLFIGLRFIHGAGGFGRTLCTIILMLESVDPRYRAKVMFWYDAFLHGSSFFMICVTYFVPSFRYIYMGTTLYQLFCLWIINYLPESPRWQLVSGKTDEAQITLRKFTSIEMTEDQFSLKFTQLKDHLGKFHQVKQLGMSSLFRHYRTTRLVLILCLIWFLRTFSSSALHYTTLDVPGNVWLNNLIISLFTTSSTLIMTHTADNYRRKVLLITFFTTNVIMFSYFAFFLTSPSSPLTIKVAFLAFGTFCNAILHNTLYVYTPEVFPTSIRNLGTGVCTLAAELAATLGPFINQLTAMTSLKVTFIGLSVACSIAALSVTLLPETKGIEMPDTVEQMLLTQINSKNKKSYNHDRKDEIDCQINRD